MERLYLYKVSKRRVDDMAKAGKPPKPAGKSGELQDLIHKITLLPDEDPMSYQGLRKAFIDDLAPGTAYERALAENLVTLEWEAFRHRRLRDHHLIAEYRDLAEGVFFEGKIAPVYFRDESSGLRQESKRLARGLISSDKQQHAEAIAALKSWSVQETEIMAQAYSNLTKSLEVHERQLADLEARRRRLRDEPWPHHFTRLGACCLLVQSDP